jgi:hypothetical protein
VWKFASRENAAGGSGRIFVRNQQDAKQSNHGPTLPPAELFHCGDAFLNAVKKHMQGGSDDQVGYFTTDIAAGERWARRD